MEEGSDLALRMDIKGIHYVRSSHSIVRSLPMQVKESMGELVMWYNFQILHNVSSLFCECEIYLEGIPHCRSFSVGKCDYNEYF